MSEILQNYLEMPVQRLDERGRELSWSINNIEHCPERKAQIQHELSMIAFEMYYRHQDGEFVFL